MIKKMKEYFKGKNPFLLASAAIVIVSVCIISMILKGEIPTGKESDMDAMSTQQSTEESITETESIQESAVTEEFEAADEVQESEPIEEPVQEDEEAASVAESESENIAETQLKPDEFVQSTPVPGKTPVPEKETPQESEIAPPEETAVPENTPAPQPTPTPEEAPMPEATPSPEKAPETHEHSWIFDSWYQEPTCSNGGLVNEICAHCGETQTTIGTPTGKHIYEVETPGDCCSAEVIICTECNHREVKEKNTDKHIDEEDGFCYGCGQKTE